MGTYLNRGMYDTVEAARLVGATPRRVATWAKSTTLRDELITPSLKGGLYSFHDLISLRVVAELVRRDVALRTINDAIRDLTLRLETDRPFAHKDLRLATVGSAVFAEFAQEWIDVSKGGQAAFQSIIMVALRGVEYGDDMMANLWRPRNRVWLNPQVQAGASCVDHRRVPTALIYSIVQSGDHPLDVAGDYDLKLNEVKAAVAFEESLSAAA